MNYQTASEFTSSTSSSTVTWKSPYIVIGRANRIIAAAEGGALSDAAEAKATIDQYAAEAKVLRALAHLTLFVSMVSHIQRIRVHLLVYHW